MKINILETTTKEGDITKARKRYLKTQIKALKTRQKELKATDPTDLFNKTATVALIDIVSINLESYGLELSNLIDTSEEYNS